MAPALIYILIVNQRRNTPGRRSPLDAARRDTASLNLENVERTIYSAPRRMVITHLTRLNPSMKSFTQTFGIRLNHDLQVIARKFSILTAPHLTIIQRDRAPSGSTFELPPCGTDVTTPLGSSSSCLLGS